MNLQTFLAMLARDAHVARRNAVTLLFQTLQPMLFVFVFGRVMTTSGLMSSQYKALLLPGVIALAMVMSGTWAVTMPLITEFQYTKEIEDRLLAPIRIEWLAIEKVVAGMVQAFIAGMVVIPAGWLLMGGVAFHDVHVMRFMGIVLLVSALSATLGLVLGCSISQQHVGLMFSMVMAPMIFFGCTYYPWAALAKFPILRRVVLINPMVYASEGLRSALLPTYPHLAGFAIIGALLLFDVAFLALGLRQFRRKAIS